MARSSDEDETEHVALLRGINVGGKNKLPMKELVPLFEQAGCRAVRTYIQSGNVVFRAAGARAARVPGVVADAIEARFGFRAPVVLRTAAELRAVAGANPFVRSGAEAGALHVVFLAERPTASRAGALDPGRSPPDELVLRGREIYLRLPNGAARTKLTNAYFDATLATTSTVRNWRTVLALAAMPRDGGR
ncbi:MAG: DUF1697 domain-containing protein [Myxococcales bacterium]|nr:DUF1697 domain-containing protein [Myxococcales bacterium]